MTIRLTYICDRCEEEYNHRLKSKVELSDGTRIAASKKVSGSPREMLHICEDCWGLIVSTWEEKE